jgi:pyruvate,water dikinase
MMQSGITVPDGFVLTTEAFEHFLEVNNLNLESSQKEVEAASLPPEIEAELRDAAELFNGVPVAVRSSGVAEDLEGASFAGQYETSLNVLGIDSLFAAVLRCWASAFSGHVLKYMSEKGESRNGGMAVIVQRLVNADAAGVAFSANPVNGDREELVINSVQGLGERLVSGQATPDEWIVRGHEAIMQNSASCLWPGYAG